MRFFISYRRAAEADRVLANYLSEGLKAVGQDVFIDVGMAVGTDWAREIGQRIDWCDFLVVLLSAESVCSEMVQGEIRLAHHRRRPEGNPRILPIRVRYDDPLDFELDSYLSRLHYLGWRTPEDSAMILTRLQELATSSTSKLEGGGELAITAPVSELTARSRPVVDARLRSRQPGGAIRASDPFYIRRDADERIVEIANNFGETLVIKAPRQMGKTSLLNRYIDECHKQGKRWAFVDFQSFTDAELDDYLGLLVRLASDIRRCLDLADDLEVPTFISQQQFTFFVEDRIIRPLRGPLVLVFDEVDRILGRPYQHDFFRLLRLWHNYRSKLMSVWEQVDLALVIATEPYLLINRDDSSPFNVTPALELGPFPRVALDDLDHRYGGLLRASELDQLFALLNGHPYLTRLAFYRLAVDKVPFSTLLQDAAGTDGPFGEHLRHLLLLIQEYDARLKAALRQAIAIGTVPDEDAYYRLHAAGFVLRRNGRVVPANLLYARFFKAVR
jgi:hypothetical protein